MQPGTQLGPYQIVSAIGSGGMGEVYRARDTRLDRIVAIKVLPESLASDRQFRERFDREARIISQLEHPHICALYDVGEQDGRAYLVMQYLEGETLAARIERAAGTKAPALQMQEALTIAVQMASALDRAHRAGIVHRDLKPGNVMLTKDGAKLLDFGLAKPAATAVAGSGASDLPTTPPALTAQGTILGTFQYMAPEQIEGQEADARTDIFAFGGVLYEMVTGRKAFEGKTQASVMAAIIEREPRPVSTLQPLTPPALDRLIRKCLAKDRDARWQSAADLEDELRWIAESGGTAASNVSIPALPAHRARLDRMLLATAGLVIAALSVPAFLYLRERPAESPDLRLEITTPATLQPLHFALSPDGSRVVFVASGDGPSRLWLRAMDDVTAQPLAGTEGGEYPFWSPDSRSIGFFAAGKLRRIDIASGRPQTLADAPNGRGGAWSRDGTILFAPTNASPLLRISASGGEAAAVTKLEPLLQSHRLPQFLPNGRQFLFFAQGNPERQGIYLGSLDGSETTRLTPAEVAGSYVDPGVLVFMQESALMARTLDVAGRSLAGDPVTIADPVSHDDGFSIGGFSVSAAGRLAYRTGASERRQLTWFDRTGKIVSVVGEPDAAALFSSELSPDGRRVAVQRSVQNNSDIWLIDVLRGGATRFTFDAAAEAYPIWSPDGTRIAFMSNRKGIYDIFVKPSSGAGAEELLLESPLTKTPLGWSPDGRFLIYQTGDPQTGWDVRALPMMGDRQPVPVANTAFEERSGQFSPDGRWVAYQSNESGRFEIYVQPFPGPGGKWQVSTAGGVDPRWRADGKELFFIAPDTTLMAVPVQASGSTFEPGTPMTLFHTRMVVGGSANLRHQYAVSGDGRFLVNVRTDESIVTPLTLILNWKPALRP